MSEEKQDKPKRKPVSSGFVSVPLESRTSVLSEMAPESQETPILIQEQLEAGRKLAKQTGQRIRRRFNKREFVKQFPQAGNDPRMAFTPEHFVLDITPMATLTVGELRNMCLAVRGHPLALQKALQVEGLADSVICHILKEEYMILQRAAE